MTRIEKMKDEAGRLNALLDDPQPGLFTWMQAVNYSLKRLNEIWEET